MKIRRRTNGKLWTVQIKYYIKYDISEKQFDDLIELMKFEFIQNLKHEQRNQNTGGVTIIKGIVKDPTVRHWDNTPTPKYMT